MNKNTLEKLEFNQIKEKLSQYCITYLGKKKVSELEPKNKKEEVQNRLNQTQEAINLIYQNSTPPFYEIADITIHTKLLEQGTFLNPKQLLELGTILKLAQELRVYFDKEFIENEKYPILSNLFDNLYSNKNIVDTIFTNIIDENTIDDRASSTLKSIRKNQRKLEQDIRASLTDMIHSSKYSKYIQENVITIRNDRFVIPIKEEYRSQIKGFVHDISNAGSTLFIEPISVFDMNNEIAELKIKEEIEIEKILQNLSNLFTPYIEELNINTNIIGELDFIFAKAKYARAIKGNVPKLNDNKEIELINAKHPLLPQDIAVPISLTLGKDFSTLLITGPNTGGKTVTLKTVGILTCMACSGMAIPADEKSSIYVFENVFADIGDDQSISDSLSTFSSHMLNIIDITQKASSNSLILVDELGSGTDPIEGANLAISILDNFEKMGALTIATTHYQELKKYALAKPSFENASVEFDIDTLTPTYRLLVGIPGKSNAFEISEKLGLSKQIIDNAKKLMHSDDVEFEDILKKIYDDKAKIEKEKEEIEKNSQEISILKEKLQKDFSELQIKEQNIISDAKRKSREILLDAKEEANIFIKKIKEIGDAKELEHLRNDFNEKIKDINTVNNTNIEESNLKHIQEKDIKPGTEVYVSTMQRNGTVLSHISKSNEVQVQIDNLKMTVNIKYLEEARKISGGKDNSKNLAENRNNKKISKSKNISAEINVIGLTVDEAIFVIDKYLDDCSLAKLQSVRIVHGKGTGKLREGIHKFLKTNIHVKSFRLGTYGEGEMGVTVVEIK